MTRTRTVAVAAATLLIALTATTAHAATAGQTFLTGGLTLPVGAIAGGLSGQYGDAATRNALSANGRYVAFTSDADTLSPAAHPDVTNVYRKDRVTGAVVLVSRATGANGATPLRGGGEPRISDDGTRVAWVTDASLTPADTDGGAEDVYVRDISTATTYLASQGPAGEQTTDDPWGFDLSDDGVFVVFDTDAKLVAADGNAHKDVYRRNLGGATVLASRNSGGVNAANAEAFEPAISGDGRWVSFTSSATDVVAGFSGGGRQIFARDMSLGSQHLVSNQAGALTTASNGDNEQPEIAGTPDATTASVYIVYTSRATDVATGGVDTDSNYSVYRRRLSETSSQLVSRATGVAGASADSRAHDGHISDDGQRVVFASDAGNLGAGADYYGVYVRDFSASTTVLASVHNEYAVQGGISGDGSVVAWFEAKGVTPDSDPDLGGVFARTYTAALGTPQYVSRPPGSAPFLAPAFYIDRNSSGEGVLSGDGRYVVFSAISSHLPGSNSNLFQIYRRDLRTGAVVLVSRATGANGMPSNGYNTAPTVSADGNRVAFTSSARLHPSDVDSFAAVYVRDIAAGTTTVASRADGTAGALPNAAAGDGSISANGLSVAFTTDATNLGVPGLPVDRLFVRRLAANQTIVAGRATGAGGAVANKAVDDAAISGDGRLVAFSTRADNLHADDVAPDTMLDIYVRDTVAHTTALVSRRNGAAGLKSSSSSTGPAISDDGRVVAFQADDETLATEAGPWGGAEQVVTRNLVTHVNRLASRAPGGAVANGSASTPSLDGDGSVVSFESRATNLLPGRGGSTRTAVFARDLASGTLSGPPAFGLNDNEPQNHAGGASLSQDGQCMAFTASGHNAFTGFAGDVTTGYVYVISGSCPKPAPAPPPAATPPTLSDVSLKRKRFRVGKKATPRIAAKRAPVGTAFRLTLDKRANVTIRIHRRAPGRRVGSACRKPTPKLRKRKACTRFVFAGSLARRGLAAGKQRIAFSGRIGKKALRPGRYRATVYAGNSAGRSKSVRLSFKVVRR